MSYKVHCYAHIFNQVRNLGEFSFSFVPRVDDTITLITENSSYEGKIIGQITSVQVDITEAEKITCYLGQVRNV